MGSSVGYVERMTFEEGNNWVVSVRVVEWGNYLRQDVGHREGLSNRGVRGRTETSLPFRF